MKRFIGILLLVLGSSLVVYALPQGWEWVTPSPQGYDLADASFSDLQNGWAVGSFGAIVHTTDGGITWTTQNSGVESSLLSVSAIDANQAWACGEYGTLLNTLDGGATWAIQPLDSTTRMEQVKFVDANHGWLCSINGIFRTTNSGASWIWQDVALPEHDGWLTIDFVDAQHGWIATGGSGIVRRTDDGGVNWSDITPPSGGWINSICMVDSLHGWVAGSIMNRTTDGGYTWFRSNESAIKISFADRQNGWALAPSMYYGDSSLYHTTDGGVHWNRQKPGDRNHPQNSLAGMALVALSGTQACLVGYSGFVSYTTDGGSHWVESVPNSAIELTGVEFLDANNGWAAGIDLTSVAPRGVIQKTEDGGRHWTTVNTCPDTCMLTVRFPDTDHGWALGYFPEPPTMPVILHTSDAGYSWHSQNTAVIPNTFLNDLVMLDSLHGWICGYGYSISDPSFGIVLKTNDGGNHWVVVDSLSDNQYMQLCAVDTNNIWIAAEREIRHTSDGGVTWVSQAHQSDAFINNDVKFLDMNHGWTLIMSGTNGTNTLIETTDGGATWNDRAQFSPQARARIFFPSAGEGWVITEGTSHLHTTDGGTTWNPVHLQAGGQIVGIDFLSPTNGWITTDHVGLLHFSGTQTNPEWVQSSSPAMPLDLTLSAYPNPFNPSTQIKINLTNRIFGQLAIYDITGRFVRRLSSGMFEAGVHDFSWDSRDEGGNPVSTGLYFCRFSSGKTSVTQRLLLLK